MQDKSERSGRGGLAILDTLSSIAFIALCCVCIWTLMGKGAAPVTLTTAAPSKPPPRPEGSLPRVPLSLNDAPTIGSGTARVAMVVFSEFKCPFCGSFAKAVFPGLLKKYIETGRVRFVFRHFPLDELHPLARPLAHALTCADRQQKFWILHDRLFAIQKALDVDTVQAEMLALGLDKAKYTQCMSAKETGLRVQNDVETGRSLGVTGTPTFFVGKVDGSGRLVVSDRITGSKPLAEFELVIERALTGTGAPTK
jgi:protein-disulfide isomerase